MSQTAGAHATTGGLDQADIHDVLRNDRRRMTIEALQEREGSATVRDLAEEIATHETGEEPPPRNKRQSVYVSLHQTHLPKLDELEIVTYDADDKTVTLAERVSDLEVYMEVVPEYGLTWGEFYFGLALLGLSTALAITVGVPHLSAYQFGPIAVGFFLLQGLAATYQIHTQQDRTVFSRFLD